MLMPLFIFAQNREYVLEDTVWIFSFSKEIENEIDYQLNNINTESKVDFIGLTLECLIDQYPKEEHILNRYLEFKSKQIQMLCANGKQDTAYDYIYPHIKKIVLDIYGQNTKEYVKFILLGAEPMLNAKGQIYENLMLKINAYNTYKKLTVDSCNIELYDYQYVIADKYHNFNIDSAIYYQQQYLKSLNQHFSDDYRRLGLSYYTMGLHFRDKRMSDSANFYLNLSLNYYKKIIKYYPKEIINIQWCLYNIITLSFNKNNELLTDSLMNVYRTTIDTISNQNLYLPHHHIDLLLGYAFLIQRLYENHSKTINIFKKAVNIYKLNLKSHDKAINLAITHVYKYLGILYERVNSSLSMEYYKLALEKYSNEKDSNSLYNNGFVYAYLANLDYKLNSGYSEMGNKTIENFLNMLNRYKNFYGSRYPFISNYAFNIYLSEKMIIDIRKGNWDAYQKTLDEYMAFLKKYKPTNMSVLRGALALSISKHKFNPKGLYSTYSYALMQNMTNAQLFYFLSKIYSSYDLDSAIFLQKISISYLAGKNPQQKNFIYPIDSIKSTLIGYYTPSLIHAGALLFKHHLIKNDKKILFLADSCLILAEQAADRALANLKNMNDRLDFVGTLKELVETRLTILLERGDTAQALELIERNRARTLHLNHVEAQLQHLNRIPPEDRQALDSLNNALTPIDIELSLLRGKTKPTPEEQKRMDALTYQKIDCEEKRLDILQKIEANIPEYTEKLHEKPQFSVAEFQRDFFGQPENQNTVCLSYFQAKDSLYAFTLSPNKISLKILPLSDSLVNAKVAYLNAWMVDSVIEQQKTKKTSLARKNFEAYVPVASELYQQLIAPVADELKGKTVIILPDNALWQLPFEALLTESVSADSAKKMYANMEESAYQILPYWVKTCIVSRRLSLYAYKKQKKTTYDYDLVAFAPVFEPKQSNSVNNSLQIRTFLRGVERWATRSTITADGRTLQPLYETVKEVKNISKNLNGRIQVYLKNDATEGAFKSFAGKSVKYFHIATHGFANVKQPHMSGLFFYPDNQQDGSLYSGEVSQMQFPCYLLTLSACETGKGKMVSGEGMVGLMYNFFKSGTENIVSSLWSVNDHSTARLMEHFYRGMADNLGPQKSLTQAKNNIIIGNNAHPYYWSAFNAYQW
jgi:CHAT domain-containing protein